MDEMKIQSNLVFDDVSGDLIGFIDLGNPMMQSYDAMQSYCHPCFSISCEGIMH